MLFCSHWNGSTEMTWHFHWAVVGPANCAALLAEQVSGSHDCMRVHLKWLKLCVLLAALFLRRCGANQIIAGYEGAVFVRHAQSSWFERVGGSFGRSLQRCVAEKHSFARCWLRTLLGDPTTLDKVGVERHGSWVLRSENTLSVSVLRGHWTRLAVSPLDFWTGYKRSRRTAYLVRPCHRIFTSLWLHDYSSRVHPSLFIHVIVIDPEVELEDILDLLLLLGVFIT